MARILVTKWWGVALVEDGKIVERRDFPKDARSVAERLQRIRRGEILEEERALARPGVEVLETRLSPLGKVASPVPLDVGANGADANVLHEASLLLGRHESRQASGERDRFVAQSVKAMDELQRTVNTLVERLREWYGLHFPEALRQVPDQPTIARLLAEAPDRTELARRLQGLDPEDSIGVEFSPEELEAIRGFAQSVHNLYRQLESLEKLVERQTRVVAPTLSGVVGALIAARLIAQAGSLENLANAPASTVQTLGAENALFLHLREGKKPPKHGILFQHALINTAPWKERGRLSRFLAAQAAIAARMDFYSPGRGDRSAPLVAVLERHVAALRQGGQKTVEVKGGRRKK